MICEQGCQFSQLYDFCKREITTVRGGDCRGDPADSALTAALHSQIVFCQHIKNTAQLCKTEEGVLLLFWGVFWSKMINVACTEVTKERESSPLGAMNRFVLLSFTESQHGRGWKGPLWVI